MEKFKNSNIKKPNRFWPKAGVFAPSVIIIGLVLGLGIWFGLISQIHDDYIEKPVQVIVAGDVMLSRSIGSIIDRFDAKKPFEHIVDYLSDADITFVNLENPISSRGQNIGSIYSFRADPRVISGLKYVGIDIVSVANNHIYDYGQIALLDTLEILEGSNISFVGAGRNYNEAHSPNIVETPQGSIAFLAYTNLISPHLTRQDSSPAVAGLDQEVIISDIKKAKELDSDLVFVSLHWGQEYETSPLDWQRDLAYALIDAGADVIVGHHPHVIQDVEEYKDGYILYSLGNLIFDQNFSPETSLGLLAKFLIRNGEVRDVKYQRVYFNELFQPKIK